MKTFKDLIVWDHSIAFATKVYRATSEFPVHEQYGLISQLRRASVSIASNIAEGSKRGSSKEFTHFLRISQGSGAEAETQLIVARNLGYLKEKDFTELANDLQFIMKMLTKLINHTKNNCQNLLTINY